LKEACSGGQKDPTFDFFSFFFHLLEIALSQPILAIVLPFSFSCNCSPFSFD